jgi:hypothetical protein
LPEDTSSSTNPRELAHAERERKLEACERAFRTFEELRGCVIGKAIRVAALIGQRINH